MGKRFHILIVDGNASIRRLIAGIVEPVAISIRECAGGSDAVAAYRAYRPDLVLMDIQLKDIDGIQATRKIRQTDPNARVVIITGYDDDELRHAVAAAGSIHYVLKENLPGLLDLLEDLEDDSTPTRRSPGI